MAILKRGAILIKGYDTGLFALYPQVFAMLRNLGNRYCFRLLAFVGASGQHQQNVI